MGVDYHLETLETLGLAIFSRFEWFFTKSNPAEEPKSHVFFFSFNVTEISDYSKIVI